MKILILSSRSPFWSANLGYDIMTSLKNAGHDVYFLSLYHFDGMQDNMGSVLTDKFPVRSPRTMYSRICRLFQSPIKTFLSVFYRRWYKCWYSLVVEDEMNPILDPKYINKRIGDERYDLIFTLFLENYISSYSLLQIYRVQKCPIFIMCVDMYAMTGGCYYFANCKRYRYECSHCPVKKRRGDGYPHENYLVKKKVYKAIDCSFLCDTYQKKLFLQSGLFRKDQVDLFHCVINENIFRPRDQENERKNLGLPLNKFIMFSGSANVKDERKGFSLLKESLSIFSRQCGKENIILVLGGKESENIKNFFDVKCISVGFLSMENLSKMYAASDVYLSPSLDDAGPSMVNQSLMCGTPVVAFEVGVAIDIIKDKGTGYVAKKGDVYDFARGIKYIYDINDKNLMRKTCRNLSLSLFSMPAIASQIENIYKNRHCYTGK